MAFIQMVDLAGLHQEIEQELQTALHGCIIDSDFIQGKPVGKFLSKLKNYLGAREAIGCGNGTDALQLALMALDLPPGAEIIVPAFSYVSAAEAVALLGYNPVFADVCYFTFNINPETIKAKITTRTKAIIAVHLFGQAADMESISELAAEHNLFVIEDNAQSLGAKVRLKDGHYKFAGTLGTLGTTSFFPTKVLGAMGDGGAVFTQDPDLSRRVSQLANHGQIVKFEYQSIGINSRLDSMQAAILDIKLKYLENNIHRLQQVAKWYLEKLQVCPEITLPVLQVQNTHVYHQFVIKVPANKRPVLQEYLKENEIASAVFYPLPLHLQPAYKYLGGKPGDLPKAEKLCQEVLALPIHPLLSKEQVNFISDKLTCFFFNG